MNTIPGWDDLLINTMRKSENFSEASLDRLGKAADNIVRAITVGLQSLNTLVPKAIANEDAGVNLDDLANVSWMQSSLMELLDRLHSLESNVSFSKHEKVAAAGAHP